jgi:hypothetical protein
MAARVGRVTFLRVLVVEEEAPRGEWEEWRTFAVGGWKTDCRLERCVVVIAVAQARTGVAARV